MLLLIPTANRHPRHTVTGCDTQGCEIGNAVNPIINHPNFNFACLHVYDITHIAVNLLQQRQINGHFGNLNCRYLPNIRRIRPMQGLCKWIYHDIPIYPQKKGFIYATVQYLYFRLLKFRKKKVDQISNPSPKGPKNEVPNSPSDSLWIPLSPQHCFRCAGQHLSGILWLKTRWI